MYSSRVKTGVFVLEGLNGIATALYFNYLFFLMRAEFGFTNLGNLFLCAVNGFVYMSAAWFGGWCAQRHGYFRALRIGFGGMGVALLAASQVTTVTGHFVTMLIWTLGMCFTWPALEAMISEREPPARLQRLLGIYNVIWAAGGGLAYFVGGAMFEKLGRNSMFLVPAAMHLGQLVLVAWLERENRRHPALAPSPAERASPLSSESERRRSPVPPAIFLRLAWIANPFSYIAINALVPVIPRLADRFHLTPMTAGFVCSVWMFARALSFVVLWHWTGWHYRFRWLIAAYLAMTACFTAILLSPQLWLLILAQLVFGLALGLIYYSSLFYSMDVGDAKAEHGGVHETAIGAGIFVGPAIGAISLRFFPAAPNLNAWAVTGLLVGGLTWLAVLRFRGRIPGDGR